MIDREVIALLLYKYILKINMNKNSLTEKNGQFKVGQTLWRIF